MKKYLIIIPGILLLYSCNHPRFEDSQETSFSDNRELLYATLYTYFAAEYKALAYQAYNLAGDRLEEIATRSDEDDLAVVLDIDETVLDNSPYQAKMITAGIQYDSCWNEWGQLGEAKAVPGALQFLKKADSLGFNIFYISNRKEKYIKEGTFKNLQNLGFPQVSESHVMLRRETSDKTARRASVSEKYEIVLLLGDNLGDFFTDSNIFSERENLAEEFREAFGRKFIVLPNAMYGTWLSSLKIQDDPAATDSLLHLMTRKLDEVCPAATEN